MKMNLILTLMLTFFSSIVLAQEVAPVPEFDALITLLGDYGATIITWICLIGYLWAVLRQMIKPERLSFLPHWLVDILEFAAANKGYAQNDFTNDPKHFKRFKQ